MIVKVQKSIITNNSKPQVLVYSRDKSIFWQGSLSKEVDKFLNGKMKAYFDAEMIGTRIALNFEVEEKDF